jgi:hypothetical protein
VDERQRDLGTRAAVEHQDHAPRSDQEADAEPADEDRQARRASVDGPASRRDRLERRPPPKPANPAEPAEKP